jgi:hypothetical protein
MSEKHILGMDPHQVALQMVRNHLAQYSEGHEIGIADCIILMMEFNQWLVSTNETLQKLVLDKINTELPKPMILDDPPIHSAGKGGKTE